MPLNAFIGMVIALVLCAGIIWIVVRVARAGRRQAGSANALYAEVGKLVGTPPRGNVFGAHDIRVGERPVQVQLQVGGRNSPPILRVSLPLEVRTSGRGDHGVYRETARGRVAGPLAVLFRRETGLDRFGKRIGLNVEHETGDAAFDDEIYIESDAAGADLEALLADSTTRQAVRALLAFGFNNVVLFRGSATVTAALTGPTAEVVARVPQAVARLAQIADNLPAFDGNPVGRATPLRAVIVSVSSLVGGFAAVIFGALSAVDYNVVVPLALVKCALIGLAGWVVACTLTYFMVRGRSDALRTFAFVFLTTVWSLPAFAVGVGTSLNGALDSGAISSHDARITRRWITTSKNSKTYHLEVESWRPDRSRIEVSVAAALYSNAVEGRVLRLSTKPGWLGWEWLVGSPVLAPAAVPRR